jgi:hypothetical protein
VPGFSHFLLRLSPMALVMVSGPQMHGVPGPDIDIGAWSGELEPRLAMQFCATSRLSLPA